MCAAHRRSGAPAGAAVAPPSALPRSAGWRDRVRLARVRRRGVDAGAGVVVGRGVVFDVAPGGRVLLGDGAALGDGCRLHVAAGATVTIGPASRLGERCAITAQSAVSVGARSVLADEVVVIDAEPRTGDVERPLRAQGLNAAPVTIGADVRVGPNAAILAGATIPAAADVDAGATVGPAGTIAAPAPPRRRG